MANLIFTPQNDLQAALDRAPAGSTVHLCAGVYRQKLVLRTPGLRLEGEGAENTVLIYDDYARKIDARGQEYNTFRTWTLAVCADDIHMHNLAVVNDALNPASKGQEVALSVYGDRFLMEDCLLRSTQDTLFLGPLPKDLIARYQGFLPDELRQDRLLTQRFTRCRIEGSVDFIFGCGEALLEDCEIRSVSDGREVGYVAAPAHALEQTEGFRFRHCTFTAEDTVAQGSIFLARPWRDHGLCFFEDCRCGRHIAAAGFDAWLDSGREKTARFYEYPVQPGRVAWVNPQREA